jgi:hypothetical protein
MIKLYTTLLDIKTSNFFYFHRTLGSCLVIWSSMLIPYREYVLRIIVLKLWQAECLCYKVFKSASFEVTPTSIWHFKRIMTFLSLERDNLVMHSQYLSGINISVQSVSMLECCARGPGFDSQQIEIEPWLNYSTGACFIKERRLTP